ncbi:hypothetical protein EV360DRAFT_74746 [Lentinula raphanica]|nr:hypothetical protein EV360DRAFT_74746 [Lentinula raphanica]
MDNTRSQSQPAPSTKALTASQAPALLSSPVVLQPSPTIHGGSTEIPDSSSSYQVIKNSPEIPNLWRVFYKDILQAIANKLAAQQDEKDQASLVQALQSQAKKRQRSHTPENQVGNAINDPDLLNAPGKGDQVHHQIPQYDRKTVFDTYQKLELGQLGARDLDWVKTETDHAAKDENGIARSADWIKDGNVFKDTTTPEQDRWMKEFYDISSHPSENLDDIDQLRKYVDKC